MGFINLSGLHLTEHVSLRNREPRPESPTCCLLQRSFAIRGPEKIEVTLHVTSTSHHLMNRRACENNKLESVNEYHHMHKSTPLAIHARLGESMFHHLVRALWPSGSTSPRPIIKNIKCGQLLTNWPISTLTPATRPNWAQKISTFKNISGEPFRSEEPSSTLVEQTKRSRHQAVFGDHAQLG